LPDAGYLALQERRLDLPREGVIRRATFGNKERDMCNKITNRLDDVSLGQVISLVRRRIAGVS
jgi:hypothetical protein